MLQIKTCLFMLGEVRTISKSFPTHITGVWFLACMQAQMFFECPLFCESSCTVMTLEWTLSFMSSSMTLPCVFMQKRLSTKLTFPWSFSSMSLHMQFKLTHTHTKNIRVTYSNNIQTHTALQKCIKSLQKLLYKQKYPFFA